MFEQDSQLVMLYQDSVSLLFWFIFSHRLRNQQKYLGIITKLNSQKSGHDIQVYFQSPNLNVVYDVLGVQQGKMQNEIFCP